MVPTGADEAALAGLPTVEARRVAVRVTPDALRHVRSGHPWIYDGSITSVSHDAPPGALAVVFDDKRRFAAIGLWDPTSPLRIRVLHAGDPITIDHAFWITRLDEAAARRRPLAEDGATTGYRWVNGESDGLPGLVVDRYAHTGVVKLYTSAWLPRLPTIVAHLATDLDRVVLRLSRAVADGPTHGLADGQVLAGSMPDGPIEFTERGLTFAADVVHGQKTGHFLDQRDNRVLVGSLSAGQDVLDVFSCTGGFSVHAAAGGARSVHTVDLSGPAIDTAVANMGRNAHLPAVRACDQTTEVGDAFRILEGHVAADRRWDVVVIDPPSFAPRQEAVGRALKAYGRLTALGLAVTRRGGLLVQSSCSSRIDADTFHRQLRDVARRSGHGLEEVARTTHPLDHPATFPEGWYLKTAFVRVDPRR